MHRGLLPQTVGRGMLRVCSAAESTVVTRFSAASVADMDQICASPNPLISWLELWTICSAGLKSDEQRRMESAARRRAFLSGDRVRHAPLTNQRREPNRLQGRSI